MDSVGSKRQKCSSDDRISLLPESIITYILSLLATKYAVLTSLLSRGWRFRWTDFTSFDIDDELLFKSSDTCKNSDCPFCPGINIYDHKGVKVGFIAEKKNFVEFVERVLSNNTTNSISKFRLHCRSPDLLSKWVSTAIDRNVRVLDLATKPRAGSKSCLPDSLYTSGNLEVLKIEGPIQLIPPQVVFLPKVTILDLNKVIYTSDESFCRLISGCPVLQSLTIVRNGLVLRPKGYKRMVHRMSDNIVGCKISSPSLKHLQIYFEVEECVLRESFYHHAYFEHLRLGITSRLILSDMKLEINAPALEYLKLHDNMSRKVRIKEPTSVKEVDLNILCDLKITNYFYVQDEDDDPREKFDKYKMATNLFQTFDRVTFMKLGCRTMDALEKISPLPACFARLAKLAVQDIQLSTMIHIIEGCSKLEALDISGVKDGASEAIHNTDSHVPGCMVSSLKHVTLRRFGGKKSEMAMLHFFLTYGLVMESVKVCFNMSIDSERRCDILNEVSKFNIVSPTCEISDCD